MFRIVTHNIPKHKLLKITLLFSINSQKTKQLEKLVIVEMYFTVNALYTDIIGYSPCLKKGETFAAFRERTWLSAVLCFLFCTNEIWISGYQIWFSTMYLAISIYLDTYIHTQWMFHSQNTLGKLEELEFSDASC